MVFGLGAIRDYLSDNAVSVAAAPEEQKLNQTVPGFLKPGEKVEFAFIGRGGNGRDGHYFTDRRIIHRDVTGITGTSTTYTSWPYSAIKAWAVSTAGGGFDSDSELRVWASGMGEMEIEFSKKKVDLFAIQKFLSLKIIPRDDGTSYQVPPGQYSHGNLDHDNSTTVSNFINWVSGDAKQVNPADIEARLKTSPPVLLPDERVEMAFRSGRDLLVLTPKRYLIVDPRGITGKKVVYMSVMWKCMRAFEIETAGTFDLDCELKVWTNLPGDLKILEQELRRGQCDVMAVQRFFADKILGVDTAPPPPSAVNNLQGQQDHGPSMMAFLGGDMRMVDPAQANAKFHTETPILQGCEVCEFCFKGRRDMILFTNKRLISIDVQGWTGKKKSFTSVPWTSVKQFGVQSAGSFMDKDSEMMIWTDIDHDYGQPERSAGTSMALGALEIAAAVAGADDADEPDDVPIPGMSYLEFDFQKDRVDLMAIQRYLCTRCLPSGCAVNVQVPATALSPTPTGTIEKLLNWLGDDNVQLDAHAVQANLEQCTILLPGENVGMAFKSGRDTFVLTNLRAVIVDVSGFTGKRVAYKSIPYGSIRGFGVESAGTFDRDSELSIYTRNHWSMQEVEFDFRKNGADIMAIQKFLSEHVVGKYEGTSALGVDPKRDTKPADVGGGVSGFLSWLGDDAHAINRDVVNQRLHNETPLLLDDEVVDMAFKCGRDMYVHTSKRVIFIDVQGWTGKKVSYDSYPLKYCTGFSLSTAGLLDRDAELEVFTDCPSTPSLGQDLRKGKVDIPEVLNIISAKLVA